MTASPAPSELQIQTVVSDFFAENCYLVWTEGDTSCVVVDPGFSPDKILAALEQRQLTPDTILLTHGHADHIAGIAHLKERWPDCPLVIGTGDQHKLTDPVANLSAGHGFPLTCPPADSTVDEGDTIQAAGLMFAVLDTPGHSIGHVVFVLESNGQKHVLGGDVLFRRGVGRTDFPDGDAQQLSDSIHNKLFTLPDETIVYPGHGPTTTIGEEREENPFVGAAYAQ